jgi:prepilin-type N-terminal cleavage/methylation domain-containing protein
MTTSVRRRRRGLDGRQSGVTLTELLLVMVIFTTVASMMAPSIVSSQNRGRMDAAVQQLTIDLARARSEAMNRNETVTVTRTGTNRYTVPLVGERELDRQITFGSGSAATISFTSYGALTPVTPRTMVLRLAGQTRTVNVSAAGFTTVR